MVESERGAPPYCLASATTGSEGGEVEEIFSPRWGRWKCEVKRVGWVIHLLIQGQNAPTSGQRNKGPAFTPSCRRCNAIRRKRPLFKLIKIQHLLSIAVHGTHPPHHDRQEISPRRWKRHFGPQKEEKRVILTVPLLRHRGSRQDLGDL